MEIVSDSQRRLVKKSQTKAKLMLAVGSDNRQLRFKRPALQIDPAVQYCSSQDRR